MTQQTFSGPGVAVAEPPAPVLPAGFDDEAGDANRRKLLIVGAALGVLVLAVVAFFLLKSGGSSSNADSNFVVPHHAAAAGATGKTAGQSGTVTLPKVVSAAAAPTGRDPFKPLYVAPSAAPSTAPSSSSTTPTTPTVPVTTGGSTTGTTGGTTAPAAAYAPVWIQLVSVDGTKSATFLVGYSNGKTQRQTSYSNIAAPSGNAGTSFASVFSLLSLQDGGATVQFGDGSPFDLLPGSGHRHPLG